MARDVTRAGALIVFQNQCLSFPDARVVDMKGRPDVLTSGQSPTASSVAWESDVLPDRLTGAADQPPRGRNRHGSSLFLALAAGLLLFAAAVGGTYLALRPVTLRIAVRPTGSHDQQLVPALPQSFAQDRAPLLPSILTTDSE